ncbi:hypothetical protein EX30DRAFT_339977 [Ascodesmis nigricans]|uniref:Uncharacterized protein n=1 Tax=Ascodesmis nigricans TaxID=341454 RepID=A0A4S2MZR3_9PEZI|nr:hypothetical protein EX30DRAFT_339977 [Ascodesmis nigricans]
MNSRLCYAFSTCQHSYISKLLHALYPTKNGDGRRAHIANFSLIVTNTRPWKTSSGPSIHPASPRLVTSQPSHQKCVHVSTNELPLSHTATHPDMYPQPPWMAIPSLQHRHLTTNEAFTSRSPYSTAQKTLQAAHLSSALTPHYQLDRRLMNHWQYATLSM